MTDWRFDLDQDHREIHMTGAGEAGRFALGGRYTVNRMGYGSMQLTGPGVWGPPRDPEGAIGVLRLAVELGVQLIDTADSYGPEIAEDLIRRALHPYPPDLLIATKAGLTRPGPGRWVPNGRPEHLRRQTESSLVRLGLDRIPLFQLHRIDPAVSFDDQIGTLRDLRDEGKIDLIGLSEVSVYELEAATRIVEIASVQNLFNLTAQGARDVVAFAEVHGIGFIPWFPLATGDLAGPGGPAGAIAHQHRVAPSQVALAWLLATSPVILPIPGTSSEGHLRGNVAAGAIHLTQEEVAQLNAPR